jgi:DNA polymerase III subunit epsilon
MRQIFLDTETTGLDLAGGDRVIEVGCVEMVDRRLSGNTRHFYLNPDRLSHADALRVHGLTDDFLAAQPRFADIAHDLVEFLRGAEIIMHNAEFDVGFLNAELKRIGHCTLPECVAKVTDTLALARETFPGKANSLDALCRRLEVDNARRTLHGALLDAELLAEVYIRMTRGQESLVIDAAEAAHALHDLAHIDLGAFELVVLMPTDEEETAHAALLADLDKASGGKAVWRTAMA